ncbi:MAG: hypothetical protein ACO3RV_08155, partial [Luteolibacter sp.]
MMKNPQELATSSSWPLSFLQAAKGMVFARVIPAILLLPGLSPVHAGCLDAVPESVLFERSEAVAKVVVLNRQSWIADNGVVATRYRLKCEKIYKGEIEAEFDIVSQGGTAAGKHHFRSDFLDLQENHSYALMLDRDRDGNWIASGLKAQRMQHGCDGHCRYLQNGARGPRPLSASPLLSASNMESDNSNIG